MDWKFSCHKKGHSPHPKGPKEFVKFDDLVMLVQFCIKCGCMYAEQTDAEPSRLVLP